MHNDFRPWINSSFDMHNDFNDHGINYSFDMHNDFNDHDLIIVLICIMILMTMGLIVVFDIDIDFIDHGLIFGITLHVCYRSGNYLLEGI